MMATHGKGSQQFLSMAKGIARSAKKAKPSPSRGEDDRPAPDVIEEIKCIKIISKGSSSDSVKSFDDGSIIVRHRGEEIVVGVMVSKVKQLYDNIAEKNLDTKIGVVIGRITIGKPFIVSRRLDTEGSLGSNTLLGIRCQAAPSRSISLFFLVDESNLAKFMSPFIKTALSLQKASKESFFEQAWGRLQQEGCVVERSSSLLARSRVMAPRMVHTVQSVAFANEELQQLDRTFNTAHIALENESKEYSITLIAVNRIWSFPVSAVVVIWFGQPVTNLVPVSMELDPTLAGGVTWIRCLVAFKDTERSITQDDVCKILPVTLSLKSKVRPAGGRKFEEFAPQPQGAPEFHMQLPFRSPPFSKMPQSRYTDVDIPPVTSSIGSLLGRSNSAGTRGNTLGIGRTRPAAASDSVATFGQRNISQIHVIPRAGPVQMRPVRKRVDDSQIQLTDSLSVTTAKNIPSSSALSMKRRVFSLDDDNNSANLSSGGKRKKQSEEIDLFSDRITPSKYSLRNTSARKSGSSASSEKILFWYPDSLTVDAVAIRPSDLHRLDNDDYLNDSLIDLFAKRHLHEMVRSPLVFRDVHLFSSYFMTRLDHRLTSMARRRSMDSRSYSQEAMRMRYDAYHRIKTWTRGVDVFSKKYLLFPVNRNAHWSLAIVFIEQQIPSESANPKLVLKHEKPAGSLSMVASETEADDSQTKLERNTQVLHGCSDVSVDSAHFVVQSPNPDKYCEATKTIELSCDESYGEEKGKGKSGDIVELSMRSDRGPANLNAMKCEKDSRIDYVGEIQNNAGELNAGPNTPIQGKTVVQMPPKVTIYTLDSLGTYHKPEDTREILRIFLNHEWVARKRAIAAGKNWPLPARGAKNDDDDASSEGKDDDGSDSDIEIVEAPIKANIFDEDAFLVDEFDEEFTIANINLVRIKVPLQNDGFNCGVYLLNNIEEFLSNYEAKFEAKGTKTLLDHMQDRRFSALDATAFRRRMRRDLKTIETTQKEL